MKRCIRAVFPLCCVVLLLAGAQGEKESSPDGHPADFCREYGQVYYDFLLEYISGREAGCEDEFSLLFIDDDDIPELLIFQDDQGAGAKVYSCREGQVAELGEYGYGFSGDMLFRERSGVVIDHFLGDGPNFGDHFYFYEIGNGTSRELCHLYSGGFFSEENEEYTQFYEIDGISVPKDTFDVKWNELSDNHDLVFHEKSYSLEEAEFLSAFTRAMEDIRSDLAAQQLLWKRDSAPVLEQVARQEEVLAAYEAVLEELAQKWSDTGRFTLIYLDGDDIPKLAFTEGYAHAAPVNIYTYDQGEAVLEGNYESEAITAYTPIKDVDMGEALREELQTLILSQYDTLKRNLLIKAGVEEDAVLLMDYDDYDGNGTYEAFAFVGESNEYSGVTDYRGHFWFVGADRCMQLPNRHGAGYRKIDGLMLLGHRQKYLYYHSDYCLTANISGIWTVENGKPVEICLPQSGEVSYTGDPCGFDLWVDSYNNYYEPDGDLWSGHTWRPYFYHYDLETGRLKPDESENLSAEELEELCGFDLAAEVEAEGYEVTAVVRWQPGNIVTINYTIPINESGIITYENIVWDCETKNYWNGAASWKNAGYGGSI